MKTMVYTCDKCRQSKQKHEVATITAALVIPDGFTLASYNRDIRINSDNERHICKQCLQSMGLFTEKENGEGVVKYQKQPDAKERFYDVFVEMLQDVGVLFEG